MMDENIMEWKSVRSRRPGADASLERTRTGQGGLCKGYNGQEIHDAGNVSQWKEVWKD